MAPTAQHWYWAERNGWFVSKHGQQHFLSDHPLTVPRPRQIKGKWNPLVVIRQRFHQLMASTPEPPVSTPVIVEGLTVTELCEKYLDWCHKHREPQTDQGYLWH